MGKFFDYNPDQAYLLPPSVRDVLGEGHLCFFLRRVVAKLDLRAFRNEYGAEGGPAYAPEMLASVWLYAYALSVTSSRRLEQRIREDLAFRYLAGGATPDYWTLNAFRRRHGKGLNDLFTQVLELARASGLGRLGHVAIDSTRLAANASRDRIDTEQALRDERARLRREIRRWQKQCDADDPNEGAGVEVNREVLMQLERQLGEIPARLERLQKSGLKKLSRSDADSRFLRQRGGFVLGYTGTLAVSGDHLIVAQRVTQETNDNEALLPMVDAVERECGERPQRVSADSGFFSLDNLQELEEKRIEGYIPDANLARWLNRGGRLRTRAIAATHRRMRRKLRDPAGRAIYQRRKAIVEPVNGVLKEQRGMRRFRMQGLAKVAVEWTLATTAYNLTRLWRVNQPPQSLEKSGDPRPLLLVALALKKFALERVASSHRLFSPVELGTAARSRGPLHPRASTVGAPQVFNLHSGCPRTRARVLRSARRVDRFRVRPRAAQLSIAANPAKSPPIAPCIIISSQRAAGRDSQHGRAIVHVHRFHCVCQRLILVLVDQHGAFRVVHLNHRRATA